MSVQEIMDAVKELKVLELSELVKALEEEFGVSATPVAVAGAAAGGAEAAAEAKTDFDVVLVEAGSSKINVIKVVREITGLGLKEAKEKVDGAPATIKEAAPEAEANEIKEKLEAAGAKVELK
ncbi:50S ribosomal protein L7/L12 [Butyricicoccus sp. Marseille-Q5471]|uniref:50S ribosomal protein L7/L12 n=1 Tax=Butyricicoccus sp. Marseille-Q5471 TaxID=3039493 RepID=UPI0024BD148D|nr:50S ribosomal protein L7/L12 [Butyricicoccus sp. Marseille-Q5471]